MLETIREYALEQLAKSGEEGATRRAHARHFVALAEQMWASTTGHEIERWLQRLRPEIGNIREALTWSLEHEPVEPVRLAGTLEMYWIRYNYFSEGRAWVTRALATEVVLPMPVRVRC
jgi:predicted ATPase